MERVIFCVDDEEIVLKSLKRELQRPFPNFFIETADSGNDALELFEELLAERHEIPVVISDQIMPDMKGNDLLRRIHERSPNTLTILLTGQADLDAVTDAVNHAELYRYIAKPWETTDLILTVKEAIRRFDQDKRLAEQNEVLRNMNAVLEQQVKERTAALEAANASKDTFFSIIAHDLRSPFHGLIGLTQLFSESWQEYSVEEIREALGILEKTTKSVYELLENLLTWSRLQRGLIAYAPQRFPLNSLTSLMMTVFSANASQKRITLDFDFGSDIFVYADQEMVNTILRNCISNALKFTPVGGAIRLAAIEHADDVEITIADNGVGMSEGDLEKLFRIDVKFSRAGTSGEKGSGLGLILCKELAEQNGGNIWVESKAGIGTMFHLTLPKPIVGIKTPDRP